MAKQFFFANFANINTCNQRWLASHLIEAAESMESKSKKKEIEFPKIPKDYKPSPRVMAMTLGPLPEGVDLEKELENRWEEWVK